MITMLEISLRSHLTSPTHTKTELKDNMPSVECMSVVQSHTWQMSMSSIGSTSSTLNHAVKPTECSLVSMQRSINSVILSVLAHCNITAWMKKFNLLCDPCSACANPCSFHPFGSSTTCLTMMRRRSNGGDKPDFSQSARRPSFF